MVHHLEHAAVLAALGTLAGLAHQKEVTQFGAARLTRGQALLVAAAEELVGGEARPT